MTKSAKFKKLNSVAIGFLILALTGCSLPPGYYGEKEIAKQTCHSGPGSESGVNSSRNPETSNLETAKELDPGFRRDDKTSISPGLKKLPLGEKLTFSIRWMGLEAGRTTTTIKEIVKINGRDCYHIEAFSRTTSILDLLFRIRDYHDSYVDCENFYTHRFVKRASEGDHTYDEVNDFDYDKNKAYYVNKKKNEHKVTDIPGKVQDIVSVSYWFRTQNVKVGDTVAAVLHSDEKNYDVTIKVLAKENFRIRGKGQIPMMVIEPKARRGTKLYKKGRAKIWVTDDAIRLPLFAELHVIIAGTLNIVLVSNETVNVA